VRRLLSAIFVSGPLGSALAVSTAPALGGVRRLQQVEDRGTGRSHLHRFRWSVATLAGLSAWFRLSLELDEPEQYADERAGLV
jgi:hypothetical protein